MNLFSDEAPSGAPLTILGLDPRASSSRRIKAPKPLPHVSKRKLAKVKHRLAIPTVCNICNHKSISLVRNSDIYGKSYGLWPYAYLCGACGAYVGLHPDTDLPLGTLADKHTRDARIAAKRPFFTVVRLFGGDRGRAYAWLSAKAEIPLELCHFSMFDEDTANRVFGICYNALFEDF